MTTTTMNFNFVFFSRIIFVSIFAKIFFLFVSRWINSTTLRTWKNCILSIWKRRCFLFSILIFKKSTRILSTVNWCCISRKILTTTNFWRFFRRRIFFDWKFFVWLLKTTNSIETSNLCQTKYTKISKFNWRH